MTLEYASMPTELSYVFGFTTPSSSENFIIIRSTLLEVLVSGTFAPTFPKSPNPNIPENAQYR